MQVTALAHFDGASYYSFDDRQAAAFEYPRPGTEQIIAGIWAKLLGPRSIGRQENFFDVGGSSLLAVRFVALAERAFGRPFTLVGFFQAPTISGFADRITSGSAVAVQKLNRGSPRGPQLFWIGAERWLIQLSRSLRSGVTVYSLEPSSYASEESTIESMAAEMTSLIRDCRPKGPYMLGGRCLPGLLAYEAAQQLLRAGEEVSLLVLTEFYAPGGHTRGWMDRIVNRVAQERVHLSKLRKLNRLQQCQYYPKRAWSRSANLLGLTTKGHHLAPSLLGTLRVAIKRYNPAPFPGKAPFFESSECRRFRPSPSETWKPFIRELEVLSYRGTHDAIVDDTQVAMLAQEIDTQITRLISLECTR